MEPLPQRHPEADPPYTRSPPSPPMDRVSQIRRDSRLRAGCQLGADRCSTSEEGVQSLERQPAMRATTCEHRALDHPLGPLGSSSSQHRRTLELVLQKSHASFRITFRPPGAEDRGTSPPRDDVGAIAPERAHYSVLTPRETARGASECAPGRVTGVPCSCLTVGICIGPYGSPRGLGSCL